jgi:predicted DCC family thiol-disulfide oxidoreductase YuxK
MNHREQIRGLKEHRESLTTCIVVASSCLRMKPVMIFDGDCYFCRRWIQRWEQSTGDRIDYIPFQDESVAERFPEVPRERFQNSVVLVESDGNIVTGAEAVFRAIGGRLWWAYQRVPGFASVCEWLYRLVARHRGAASTVTRVLYGSHVERTSYTLVRWWFLRLLGLTYLIAFVSLWSQLAGLVGSHGILPATEYMSAARQWSERHGGGLDFLLLLPTLCWFNASDAFLNFLCAAGVVLSVFVIGDILPVVALAGLWVLYLSLTVVGQDFLLFQWDTLLLETGFLAIFFAMARKRQPSLFVLWMLRWLLFRLIFRSGVVKLAGGDLSWTELTALTVHYETQPLPTWIGWYAHQLPLAAQKFSCGVMFVIELIVPWMIFLPRRPRCFACGALVLLQLLIALTGNYCFFNLLTIALCLLLLDDAHLTRWLKWPRLPQRIKRAPRIVNIVFAPFAAAILLVTGVQLFQMRRPFRLPRPVFAAQYWTHQFLYPFRSVNQYGLFAAMTTSRREIIVEGSNDRVTWLAYEFKYKPGDVRRRPAFVEPHQPRLDWQMWFAALRDYRDTPWFLDFCGRLLRGQPEVLALLKTNPFPEKPPRYIRALVYDYHFTDFKTRRATGQWWRRELKGLYCPVVSLRTE